MGCAPVSYSNNKDPGELQKIVWPAYIVPMASCGSSQKSYNVMFQIFIKWCIPCGYNPRKHGSQVTLSLLTKVCQRFFYWLPGHKRTTTQEEELVKFIGVPVKPAAIPLLANKGIQSIINPQVEEQNI